MKYTSFFKGLDLVGQTIILIPSMISIPFAIVAPGALFLYFMGLFFLGGWQLLSALCHFLFAGDFFRGWYLMASITYCGLLYLGVSLANKIEFSESINIAAGIYFIGIIPGIAGLWYYNRSLNE